MKTWEIYRDIEQIPSVMMGKRFKFIKGLEGDEHKIGDISIITQYHMLVGFGQEKYSKIRITDLTGFEEWQEVIKPVTFIEACQDIENNHSKIYKDGIWKLMYKRDKLILREKDGGNIEGTTKGILLSGDWYLYE